MWQKGLLDFASCVGGCRDAMSFIKANPSGLGRAEIIACEKALASFTEATDAGKTATPGQVDALVQEVDGPLARLVANAEALDFVEETLEKIEACLDANVTPGVKHEEASAVKAHRALLLRVEGNAAYARTRVLCESRSLDAWDAAFREVVHAGLDKCLARHRRAAALLRECKKRRPLAKQLKYLGECAQMLPAYRTQATGPLEEACVLFRALGDREDGDSCRLQLDRLKKLQRLTTQQRYACDADLETQQKFLPPEYQEREAAPVDLFESCTFGGCVVLSSEAPARHGCAFAPVEAREIDTSRPDKRRFVVSGLLKPPLPLPPPDAARDLYLCVVFKRTNGPWKFVSHAYRVTLAQLAGQPLGEPQVSRRTNAWHGARFGLQLAPDKRRQLEYLCRRRR